MDPNAGVHASRSRRNSSTARSPRGWVRAPAASAANGTDLRSVARPEMMQPVRCEGHRQALQAARVGGRGPERCLSATAMDRQVQALRWPASTLRSRRDLLAVRRRTTGDALPHHPGATRTAEEAAHSRSLTGRGVEHDSQRPLGRRRREHRHAGRTGGKGMISSTATRLQDQSRGAFTAPTWPGDGRRQARVARRAWIGPLSVLDYRPRSTKASATAMSHGRRSL